MKKASSHVIMLAAALALAGTACAADSGQANMGEREVRDALTAAGYTDIEDVERDDGMWEADAEQGGVDYDLYLDPETAEVVARKRD